MAKKGRTLRRRKQTRRRHTRVALTRLSTSVGMIEPVRVHPPTLVPSKGLEIKSQEESK